MIFKKEIKLFILNLLSIFYTIPKLIFISFVQKKYINLVFSSSKLTKQTDVYRVDLNFDSDLIWNPSIPLPFLRKKVQSIYSIHFVDKLPLDFIETHIIHCRKNLLKDDGKYFLSVKDSSFYIDAYSKNSFSLFYDLSNKKNFKNYGLIDQINNLYREGNMTLFDEEYIKNLFLKNGFKKIIKRKFNYSFDLPNYFNDSIYLTAHK